MGNVRKSPFTQAIFVALKLQPVVQFVIARLFRKQKLCACSKGETATYRVSRVVSQTAAINCTKTALKSQLVYTRDFEVSTLVRQKNCIKLRDKNRQCKRASKYIRK